MRRFEKMLLCGTGYTVLILTMFYIFAAIVGFEDKSISIGRFFIVLAFGMIIALAELIYNLLTLKRVFKYLIHYALLLIAFIIVFMLGEFITVNGPASVFVGVTIFTALYFLIYGIVYLVRRTVGAADDRLDKHLNQKADSRKVDSKPKYTPKFK